ncbi:hypothetical protein [Microbacterium aerolatum]|uniref:hypothetical protein n=1 Tax=Microbacterium aerolatum TaxID=153731 RepID=UPI00384C24E5
MSILTEEEFNAASAAELVYLVYDMEGEPAGLCVQDVNGNLDEIDRDLAMALAERILHLAQSLPNPRQILPRHRLAPEKVAKGQAIARQARREERILRRASDVDERLRALDN